MRAPICITGPHLCAAPGQQHRDRLGNSRSSARPALQTPPKTKQPPFGGCFIQDRSKDRSELLPTRPAMSAFVAPLHNETLSCLTHPNQVQISYNTGMTYQKQPRPTHFCECGDHAWTALTRGYVTLVSPEDAHFLQERSWSSKVDPTKKTIYARCKDIKLHRAIIPEGDRTDHKDGNGLDNRRPNLRPATNQQNAQNGTPHHDSTSKFKGVSWDKQHQKWRACIYVEGKQTLLGRFSEEIFAAFAYDNAAKSHFGEFCRLNFPL